MKLRTALFLSLALLLTGFGSFAQQTTGKTTTLQLDDNGQIKKYTLSGFSYSTNRVYKENVSVDKQQQELFLSLSFKKAADKTLLQWIADPASLKSGKIIITNNKTGKTEKEFVFKSAYITSTSEAFYDYAGSGADEGGNLSLSLGSKQFSIDGVQINSAQ